MMTNAQLTRNCILILGSACVCYIAPWVMTVWKCRKKSARAEK